MADKFELESGAGHILLEVSGALLLEVSAAVVGGASQLGLGLGPAASRNDDE
jgi:hypothetical protein